MVRLRMSLALLAVLVVAAAGCAPKKEEPMAPAPESGAATTETPAAEQAAPLVAKTTLAGREGSNVSGTVTFTQEGDQVKVVAHVEGAEPGKHGFHIHETGDCSAPDFSSAGGHFNPTGAPHACPPDENRHAGDLGNIDIGDDGTGNLELDTDLITVAPGDHSVVGKAVILHEGEDDCTTQPTGNAGGRLACGVIALEPDMGATAPAGGESTGTGEPAAGGSGS